MNVKDYNPISWLIWLKLIPKQGIFVKLKFFLFYMIIYSLVIGFLDYKYDIIGINTNLGQFHLLFSFCLSIVVVFRINVAYARWWEGRGYWGNLVNNIRNLAIKFDNFVGLDTDSEFQSYLIAFPTLLKFYLRKKTVECLKIAQQLKLSDNNNINPPTLLIYNIEKKINNYRTNGKISFEQFLMLDNHITAMTDILGGCEKIANTSVPISFSIFTRFALLFYMLIFPFGWVSSFGYLIFPIIIVIIYVLLGLEVLAEEMEEPFGEKYNDLPLDAIADTIVTQIQQIRTYD